MLTRLNFLRRGYSLSQVILLKYRPIHLTSSLLTNKTEQIPPIKKKQPVITSTFSHLSASEISEAILKRLHLGEQRGVVKALIIGSGIVLVSTVLFLYVFRTPLKNQTVAQVADVAKSSLEQGKCLILHLINQRIFFSRQCQTTSQRIISRIDSKSVIRSKHSIESSRFSRAYYG